MTTVTTEKTNIVTTAEDRANIEAIGAVLRQRGHRVMYGAKVSATAVISYALARVAALECSANGTAANDRNAA